MPGAVLHSEGEEARYRGEEATHPDLCLQFRGTHKGVGAETEDRRG